MAYFFSNVRIQAVVLVPGGVFLVSTVRIAPCAIMATWFFNNFPIFGLVHQFDCAASWEVSSVVIFIKNIRHLNHAPGPGISAMSAMFGFGCACATSDVNSSGPVAAGTSFFTVHSDPPLQGRGLVLVG